MYFQPTDLALNNRKIFVPYVSLVSSVFGVAVIHIYIYISIYPYCLFSIIISSFDYFSLFISSEFYKCFSSLSFASHTQFSVLTVLLFTASDAAFNSAV